MLAAMQERTEYRPTADSALMKWIVRHAAWLIPRFRGNDVQSSFYRAMGGPYRGKLVEFGETVLAHLPKVGKGSGDPAPKLADRWKSAVWLGKSDLTDEHLVRTDDGVVYARSVRRLAEHSWSEENHRSNVETPQMPRSTATDDTADLRAVPEVRENDNENEGKNEDESENGKPQTSQRTTIMTCRGRCLRSLTQLQRRARDEERSAQKHKRECVYEETGDDEIAEATGHTCPTFRRSSEAKTDEENGPEERRLSHEHRCRSAERGEHPHERRDRASDESRRRF